MSTLVYKQNHAVRNQEVAQYLFDNTEYYDWVITSSFYSAINIVKYKIFPLILDGETFRTFERYKDEYQRSLPASPHTILQQLVNKLPEMRAIRVDFKILYDECHSSRYKRYECSEEEAKNALIKLSAIMKHCNTDKPKVPRSRKH